MITGHELILLLYLAVGFYFGCEQLGVADALGHGSWICLGAFFAAALLWPVLVVMKLYGSAYCRGHDEGRRSAAARIAEALKRRFGP